MHLGDSWRRHHDIVTLYGLSEDLCMYRELLCCNAVQQHSTTEALLGKACSSFVVIRVRVYLCARARVQVCICVGLRVCVSIYARLRIFVYVRPCVCVM